MSLFDIDADGQMDIIGAAIKEGEVAWWRNNGSRPIEWEKQVIAELDNGALYVHAKDFDGDGDGDVAATGIFDSGTITLWINQGGSPTRWQQQIVAEELDEPHGIFLEDLDGDGDTDLLATVAKEFALMWWENRGLKADGTFSLVQHVITEDFNQTQSVMAADVDKDGAMDVLASSMYASEIAWWRNLGGNPIKWEKQMIGERFTNAHWAEIGDLNNDGHLDGLGAAYNDDEISIWLSDGENPIGWTKQVLDEKMDGALTVIPADLDDDGNLDVIGTANNGHTVVWWRNDGGSPIQWERRVIDSNLYGAWPVVAGDIDNDGDTDVVAGGDRMKTILFWENTLYSAVEPKAGYPIMLIDPNLTYQEVSIPTSDGIQLSGYVYQPEGGSTQSTAIFLGHEASASHMVWKDFASMLAEKGYLVLSIDFRGHTEKGGTPDFKTNGTDVRAALDYLGRNGFKRYVCIGSSMGGTGCLAASKTHQLAGLGMISSPKVIVRSVDKITRSDLVSLTIPKVVAVAENDKAIFNEPDFVNDILLMYEQMAEPKTLVLVPGLGHGTELLYGETGDDVQQALMEMIESVAQKR